MLGNADTKQKGSNYPIAIFVCVLTAIAATPLRHFLDLANIIMLFLLVVFLVAFKLGRGPAVMSAFLAVALFDFFFVPPRLTFAVADVQYLVTFAVMLAVGLATAHLTATLSRQSAAAIAREQQTRNLYELARDLAGAATQEQVSQVLSHYMEGAGHRATLHLLDASGELPSLSHDIPLTGIAHMAINQGSFLETTQLADAGGHTLVSPLKSPVEIRGVMVAEVSGDNEIDKHQFEAVAHLVSIAVERLHYVDVVQQTLLEAATERLRSSVLSSLSHDLRTPLTGLVGMADALALSAGSQNDAIHHDSIQHAASAIRDQARAMSQLVGNLLDMARLHAGKVELRKDWQLFEDVIGSSLKLLKSALEQHPIKVSLAPDLPLVQFDDVLLERVLCNLLENAAKYSPAGLSIEVLGFVQGEYACITVQDHGPGFPADRLEAIFRMFVRGEEESSTPGVGLGLAICRAIVEAHGGTIKASNADQGGACITLCLPLGVPPVIEPETESLP